MILFNDAALPLEAVVALARGDDQCVLDESLEFRARIDRGAEFLDRLLREDGVIYGVTTGYGDSCTTAIPLSLVEELPEHLYTFHNCGLGRFFSAEASRAVLAARLVSLCRGYSGVRYRLLEALANLLKQDVIPLIPEEGSVGASGDLTPLSYVAAVLCGRQRVYWQGRERLTSEVFSELGIEPLTLAPKEGLALMNGTAVMTALACLAYGRAQYLLRLATRITALMVVALEGNAQHFDRVLFDAKPHPGMQKIAAWLRADLDNRDARQRNQRRLQDRYSLRCAPHVLGVLADSQPWWRQFIEHELNSANDNPLIDATGERVMHGGHFYGGHIASVMDHMKTTVANVADLLDRQLAQLVDPKFNQGLPANLVGVEGERKSINHGFKAVQIGASAWTAEALKLCMPASVFSRSTECHNQDKVSMGTIAARDCLRVLELTEQVAAAALMAACQGVELRRRMKPDIGLPKALEQTLADVRRHHGLVGIDRPLDTELRALIAAFASADIAVSGDASNA